MFSYCFLPVCSISTRGTASAGYRCPFSPANLAFYQCRVLFKNNAQMEPSDPGDHKDCKPVIQGYGHYHLYRPHRYWEGVFHQMRGSFFICSYHQPSFLMSHIWALQKNPSISSTEVNKQTSACTWVCWRYKCDRQRLLWYASYFDSTAQRCREIHSSVSVSYVIMLG